MVSHRHVATESNNPIFQKNEGKQLPKALVWRYCPLLAKISHNSYSSVS